MRNPGVFLENENSRLPEEVSWKGSLSTKKKKQNPKHDSQECILLGGLAEDYRPEDSLPSALRNCPMDGEEVSMHAIVVKG